MGMAQDLLLSPLSWGLQYCRSAKCLSSCHCWMELLCRNVVFFIVNIVYLCGPYVFTVSCCINIRYCTIILVLCFLKGFRTMDTVISYIKCLYTTHYV
jgi:hypothetical protein